MTKRIMVTGGAGFIGSNLCRRLLVDPDVEVIAVDNFCTGRRENIEELLRNEQFSLLEHDIVAPFPKELHVDEIYNLACPASPPQYQKNPLHTLKSSVLGAMHVIELARQNRAVVLQASTSEVYGNPLVHPQSEDYLGNVNCTGIRACYDEGKRCAETIFFEAQRIYGTRIKIVRLFNTYGPYMDVNDGRVVSNFIWQLINDKPLTVYGDGSQTRSFCYVDDTVEGLMKMMASPDMVTGPINIGNPEERTVKETAMLIQRIVGKHAEIIYRPLPQDDPIKRCPEISKARKILNWEPQIDFAEGIRRTVNYFRQLQ